MDCPTHVIKCPTNKDFTVHTGNIAAMPCMLCLCAGGQAVGLGPAVHGGNV